MRSRPDMSIVASLLVCATCVGSSCGQTQTPGGSDRPVPRQQEPATSPASQASAMELGFAAGGMLALVAVPITQRQPSFAGFTREDAELRAFVKQLPIAADAVDPILALRQGYVNANSIAGAQRILEGTNLIKSSLSASPHPDLMHVFRIGFAVGFTAETLIIVARSHPSDEVLAKYVPLMRQYRSTLVDDLARADLSQGFIDAVGRIDQDASSVKRVQDVINACLTVKDLATRLPSGQSATAGKDDAGAWESHAHPRGFTFKYPTGWTVEDDTKNKTTLLLPPGVTLNSSGPHAIFIVDATPLQNDAIGMRAYFERQLKPARFLNYTQEPLKTDTGSGAVLSWELEVPPDNIQSSFRSFVMIMRKNWAVHIDAFGPSAITAAHDATIRKIAESLEWQ